MSAPETRRLIDRVSERFKAMATEIPMQPYKDHVQAIAIDLHSVLSSMLARIEAIENQSKKQ